MPIDDPDDFPPSTVPTDLQDLSGLISGVQSENGTSCTLKAEDLVGEAKDRSDYVGVVIYGKYEGSSEYVILQSKLVKNPYAGMNVDQETNGDDSEFKKTETDGSTGA